MTSAIMVFIKQSVNDNAIPFRVSAKNAAYHEKLMQAKHDCENGRKNYHYHDFIEIEDGKTKARAKYRR